MFIITDDMLPKMFNFLPEAQGRYLTPNLDRLAAEGTVMMGQHVVSPVCTPSRYNCLTGEYASRAQSQWFLNHLRDNGQTVVQWTTFIVSGQETLPRRLQRAGYVTGMVGKNHVIEVMGINKPKWKDNPRDPEVLELLRKNAQLVEAAAKTAGFDYAESLYHNNPNHNGIEALAVHNVDWITKAGLDFIDQNADRPFFLYFATTLPHGPADSPRSWNANPAATAEGYLDQPLDVQPARETIPQRLAEAGLNPEHNVGNMLWLDDAVGALMDSLEAHSLDDNTIVVFFNDHGQTAKGTVYQGGVHNPSVVWRKGGFPSGGVNHAMVSNIDFAPTILDWVGVDYDEAAFDGRSFAPVLEGQSDEIHESLYFEMGYTRGVRKGDWKYLALRYPTHIANMTIEERQRRLDKFNNDLAARGSKGWTTDPSAPFSHIQIVPGGGSAERASIGKYPAYYEPDQLYNLALDPNEQVNLAGNPEYAQQLVEMKAELKLYLNDLPGDFAELASPQIDSAE
ncbi:sulfatase family protein [Algisphaera agarilytica]